MGFDIEGIAPKTTEKTIGEEVNPPPGIDIDLNKMPNTSNDPGNNKFSIAS